MAAKKRAGSTGLSLFNNSTYWKQPLALPSPFYQVTSLTRELSDYMVLQSFPVPDSIKRQSKKNKINKIKKRGRALRGQARLPECCLPVHPHLPCPAWAAGWQLRGFHTPAHTLLGSFSLIHPIRFTLCGAHGGVSDPFTLLGSKSQRELVWGQGVMSGNST